MNNKFSQTSSALVLMILSTGIFAQTCSDFIPLTAPDDRFTVGGGIVTDKKTGLVWQQCAFGQVFKSQSANDPCEGTATLVSWKDALDESSRFEGGNNIDWRLPNLKELSSLAELACFEPAINETMFPTTLGQFWTSTPEVWGTGASAWVVDFNFGGDGKIGKSQLRAVRMVSGGDTF